MAIQILGGKCRVIEEGNSGRTTGIDDPTRIGRNGLDYLPACLDSHVPLDLVIFMLGTNDLKQKYQPSPEAITLRMQKLVQVTQSICGLPSIQILVLSPPIIKPRPDVIGECSYPEAVPYSRALCTSYEQMCKIERVHFMNAALYVDTSELDGGHFDEQNHNRLAVAVWDRIQKILSLASNDKCIHPDS